MNKTQRFLKAPNFACGKQRFASSGSNNGGSSKFLILTAGGLAAAGAGVAGYASYDSNFRKQIEASIPVTKNVLNYAIGPEEPPAPRLKDLRPLQFSNDPKIPPKPFEPKPVETLQKKSIGTVEKTVEVKDVETVKKVELKKELIGVKIPEAASESVASLIAGKPDKMKPAVNKYLGNDSGLDKNEMLTKELKNKLVDAERATQMATSAKLETIRAIENHIQKIREAIEAGKDGDWEAVTVAHLKAKKLTQNDVEAEKKARNKVAELVMESNFGSQAEQTQLNPLIPISKATAEKLSNELDEMVSTIKKVDSERIFTRDYGNLVDESRKKFMLELKAIHPELDYEEGKKMKKGDLKTILAHAHLRVDQLSLKLIDMKLKEEQRINEAISKKKEELLEKLKLEAEEKAKQSLADNKATLPPTPIVIPEIDKKKFDEELKKKTKEIQEKYNLKLEQVVRTQKKLYDIEHSKDIENSVQAERNVHSIAIGKALAQLEGIEKALKGHVEMDIENRKSKQMWIATQNLVDTVKYGNRSSCCMEGRRAPLGEQMKTLLKCSGKDEFIKLIDKSMKRISKVKGEYTSGDLDKRFEKVCRIGRRIAFIRDGREAGVLAHLYSWFKSSITVTLPVKKSDNKVNPSQDDNIKLLEKAEYLWKQGRRLDAIRVLQITTGATRRLAHDFIEDARRHEETLYLARLLLAHSALTSIRSTY